VLKALCVTAGIETPVVQRQLWIFKDVWPQLEETYGLQRIDQKTLAETGDAACGIDTDWSTPPDDYIWPEAEIVQALFDKVDELEALEMLTYSDLKV